MTNQEAINILSGLSTHYNAFSEESEAICKAMSVLDFGAIEEPCDDCISRQAAMDACDQSINIFDATDRIRALPSVTPVPKIGRWIADVDRWGEVVTTVNGYRCSECNEFDADNDSYCPSCGCRMQEVDVKLVIDISEEEYNRIQSMDWNNGERWLDEADRVIHRGVPIEKVLEDIKAEVERHCSITVGSDNEPAMTLHDIFGILNKHISGKE